MARISVIIPVYNSKKYLNQCIDSVLQQTLTDMEIICIDDGSDDGSGEVLDEYAKKDNRVKVIHKSNSGYGASMNVGLSNAEGEYIGIVESDDFIEPTMFDILYNQAEEKKAEVVKAMFYDYTDKGGSISRSLFDAVSDYEKRLPPFYEPLSAKEYPDILQGYVYLWSGIYRRDFLEENAIRFNETPGASFQDVDFTYKVYVSAKRLMFIEDNLYHYRRDNENSSVYSKCKVYCICDEFSEVWSYLKKWPSKYDIYKLMLPPAQFRRYGETRGRLSEKYIEPFQRRMIMDFDELEEAGLIDKNNWAAETWINYLGQREVYEHIIIKHQRISSFNYFINKSERIYVYGAGKVAQDVLSIMDNTEKIKAFIVSSIDNNPQHINGIEIIDIERYCAIKKEEDVILVAVKDEDQNVIASVLHERGCKLIVQMTKNLRNIIKGTTL